MEFYHRAADKIIAVDIYADDTIEMGYYKLSVSLRCSIDNIYLFSKQHRSYTPSQVFNVLTIPFTEIPQFHVKNFLSNLNEHVPSLTKQYYLEDDLWEIDKLVDFSIGQNIFAAADPENATDLKKYMYQTPTDKFQTLFLDYMPFFENKIYVVLKDDLDDEFELYFKHTLNSTAMESKYKGMHDIFSLPMPDALKEGISNIVCRIDPIYPMSVPLDIVFNLLHVSEEAHMIQYNSGNEETIVYKLLSHEEDLRGNKIPALPLNIITKQNQSYKRSITVLFTNDVKYAFMSNGSIILEAKCTPSAIDGVNALLLTHEDILKQVGDFMYQSGYAYPTFTGIQHATILDLEYDINFKIDKLYPHNCSSHFFIDMDETNVKRYRRVSDFNENSLIHEICTYGYLNGDSGSVMAEKIKNIFQLTKAESTKIIEEFMQSMQFLEEQKKRIKKSGDVTGFPTIVKKSSTILFISMSNIKSLHYIESIRTNMKAYVALLSSDNKHIHCYKEKKEIVQVVEEFTRISRYSSSESESESDEEFEVESNDFKVESESESEKESASDFEVESGSDSEDFGISGGGKKDEDLIIKNPSFLITRIKKYFKDLPENYSRKCDFKYRPVALSAEEAAHENVKYFPPMVLDGATYICPMYWDMKRKIPLRPQDIPVDDDGNKIGIINPKMVELEVDFEKNGTIIEIGDGEHNYPGLIKNNGGPRCKAKPQSDQIEPKVIHESKQYIIEHPTTIPSEPGRVSYLPQPIRYFFGLAENCNLEEGNSLLRYSTSPPNTFLDCIFSCASLIYPKKFTMETLLRRLSEIASAGFTTYNNGNFPLQFKTTEEFIKVLPHMDYTYLWEIICDFFVSNLVIFRVKDTDLEIICPSNHYTTRMFDPAKKVIMMLEHENKKFEALIEHNVKKNYHNLYHLYYHPIMHKTFEKLRRIYENCTASSNEYTTNIIAEVMRGKLGIENKAIRQVIHHYKCIGLVVNDVFVPCYPSAILRGVDIEKDVPRCEYSHTKKVLLQLSDVIPCKPVFKVVEDDEIVGMITETNSFVPCIPSQDTDMDLDMYDSHIFHEYEKLSSQKDSDRVNYMNRSKLEKYMYAACRRLLKDMIGRTPDLRNKINAAIKTKTVTESMIESILDNHVHYVDVVPDDFIREQLKCKGYCFASDKLIVPKQNLVDNKPNQYFSRLANELNHYVRLSTFITKPQLLIQNIPYSVNDNEILLTSSMVESYHNELMEAKRLRPYYTTYDNANPNYPGIKRFRVVKKDYIVI